MFDVTRNNGMIALMDASMTLASKRQTLIASNLANIDTPGYHTRDFNFEGALKSAMEAEAGQHSPAAMRVTHAGHQLPTGTPGFTSTADPLWPSWERNDGNDVNLDRENMLLARTQQTYQTASLFMQAQLRQLYFALREANK
jgi:flagellar basal-body rod protein FlgB